MKLPDDPDVGTMIAFAEEFLDAAKRYCEKRMGKGM